MSGREDGLNDEEGAYNKRLADDTKCFARQRELPERATLEGSTKELAPSHPILMTKPAPPRQPPTTRGPHHAPTTSQPCPSQPSLGPTDSIR